jgi:hypothetical protein
MAKLKVEIMQFVSPFYLAIVLSLLFIWPLYCLSFLFGHYIVSPFYLAIVLSLLFICPLYCLSFLFGHYIVFLIKRRDNIMAK